MELLQPPLLPITAADRVALEKIAKDNCKKNVGVLRDISKLNCLKSAERLLIFKKEPKGNGSSKYRYEGIVPFKLINRGNSLVMAALGFKDYEIVPCNV